MTERRRVTRRRATPRRRDEERWTTEEWVEATCVMLLRCAGLCELCGKPLRARVERHHRKRKREGGDSYHNVVLLHPECHSYVHLHPAHARELGLIVSVYGDPLDAPMLQWGRRWIKLHDDGSWEHVT